MHLSAKTLLLAAAVAVALPGCVSVQVYDTRSAGGFDPGTHRKPDPGNPNVWVVDDLVVVDQEPVRPKPSGGRVVITWKLERGSNYVFPADGIVFDASPKNPVPADFRCNVLGAKAQSIQCSYTHTGRGAWKYTIKVMDGTRPLESLDPWVVQN